MTVFGVAIKPRCEIKHKTERLTSYLQDQQIFSKEKVVVKIIDVFHIEENLDQFLPGDTVVFVCLKDLHYLGLSTTLRDLLAKQITVHILPFFDK